ncbi:C69 family dipeptidase [Anaerococcus degeneri]|uniref:Dipeptidase n=1 Tax=Anaerococcus degeneri TaxID=361500 RepID=A0ABS7YWP5_9FIRM|nr:C69 family dipeptidase [Anaerococcus degeneri]MBP2015264.1 dipeptidase [Anaerococcus degeneri]MCA2096160.1 C69 family dipeptidase [Anaerococcus degeneri]
MACTTILVGKKASFDGSTLVARNEDSGSGQYNAKKFVFVKKEDQPKVYKSVISKVEIPLPENPLSYTAMPEAVSGQGIWAACGVNSKNVAMTATETITSNERVLGADPLVVYQKSVGTKGEADYKEEIPGGIGEEDIVSIVLPYINSAREGVIRLGSLLEEYGTYEKNGIAFQDENEIWWLETIGGHHWIARKVPDDSYVIMPNQLGLDYFDLEDALGKGENFLCSADLKDFIEKYHLDLSLDGSLNPRDTFGSHSDADHVYNTPRAWVLQRYFNPMSNTYDGIDADLRPDDDDIPWARVPERKITVEDIKYALSHHFQGTPYDPYKKHGDTSQAGAFRPIGINRNNFLGLTQIRSDKPDAIKTIEWLALGSNTFNAMAPFYVNITDTPAYLRDTTARVTTESFYWINRIIAALADPYFADTANLIERYQEKIGSFAWEMIYKTDEKIIKENLSREDSLEILEKTNDQIAKMLQKETDDLLDQVLLVASNKMTNSFSRSDA